MTTYTLTEAQRQQLLDVCLAGVSKANSLATKLLQSLTPQAAPSTSLTKDQFDSLVDDLAEWSRHVEVDTAPTTLTKHIEKVLAIYKIKGGE